MTRTHPGRNVTAMGSAAEICGAVSGFVVDVAEAMMHASLSSVLTLFEPQQGGAEVPSYGTLLLKTVLALIAVCVLAYAVLRWGLKWIMPGRSRYLNGMRVLDRQVLEGRRCMYLVEAGERGYLLAMTDTAVTVVAEYGPEELQALVEAARERKAAEPGAGERVRSFWERLRSGGRKGGPDKNGGEGS